MLACNLHWWCPSSLSQLNALQGTQSSRERTTRPIGAKETKLKKASYRHRRWLTPRLSFFGLYVVLFLVNEYYFSLTLNQSTVNNPRGYVLTGIVLIS